LFLLYVKVVKQKTPRGERSGLKLSEEVRARLEDLRGGRGRLRIRLARLRRDLRGLGRAANSRRRLDAGLRSGGGGGSGI